MTARHDDRADVAASARSGTDYESPRLEVIGSVVELTQKGMGTDAMGSGNAGGAGSGGSVA